MPWTPETEMDIRVDVRLRLGRIAQEVLRAEPSGLQEARRLVIQIERWLRENRAGILTSVHDHFGRRGLRSHALAVSCLMMNFAHHAGHDREYVLEMGLAGLFHDIGKLTIPDEILDKPGRLDAAQAEVMRGHAESGGQLLERWGLASPMMIAVCRHHHERLDGSGYPGGLIAKDIAEPVRVATICDVYDALISSRSYKQAWSSAMALDEMRRTRGSFDPDLLALFARSLEEAKL
ncbi:HD-GYP domain-containing protein [Novosphingobium profundi]|uniref:HD-GYP domain-containing protein n=1 Tax=Novosphingobium profundi TaxID=1774954 RepID=UPI001CFF0C48|nr:HD domain-containing phosphohydrolase [Novosphingobium profundi]